MSYKRIFLFLTIGLLSLMLIANEAIFSFHKRVIKGGFRSVKDYLGHANITLTHSKIDMPKRFFAMSNEAIIKDINIYAGNGKSTLKVSIPDLLVHEGMMENELVIKMPEYIVLNLSNRGESTDGIALPTFSVKLYADRLVSRATFKLKKSAFHLMWNSWVEIIKDLKVNLDRIEVKAEGENIIEGRDITVNLSNLSMNNIFFSRKDINEEFDIEKKFLGGSADIEAREFFATQPGFFGEYANYVKELGVSNIKLKLDRDVSEKHGRSSHYKVHSGSFIISDMFSVNGGGDIFLPIRKKSKFQSDVNSLDLFFHIRNYSSIIDMMSDIAEISLKKVKTGKDIAEDIRKNKSLFKEGVRRLIAKDEKNMDIKLTLFEPEEEVKVNGYSFDQLLVEMDLELEKDHSQKNQRPDKGMTMIDR